MIVHTTPRFRGHCLALACAVILLLSVPSPSFACDCPPPPTKQPKCASTAEWRFPAGSSAAVSNPLGAGSTSELKVVVFGDSVMWGDGLRPEHKFVYLFGQDLASLTGRPVRVVSYAHSGARLYRKDDLNSVMHELDGKLIGDLDSQRPTTVEQEECSAKTDSDAEVVLLDGCINDVGATDIAVPFPFNWTQPETIAEHAEACLKPMQGLLQQILSQFPNATIIDVNYYRVVSPDSHPAPLMETRTRAALDLTKEQQKLWAASKKPLPPVPAAPHGAAPYSTQASAFLHWAYNSDAFLNTSQDCFNNAVGTLDQLQNPQACLQHVPLPYRCPTNPVVSHATPSSRVYLATIDDKPELSYGASKTRLWPVPVGNIPNTHDDFYDQRQKLCKRVYPWWFQGTQREKCMVDVTAHPNLEGAKDYEHALTAIIQGAWGMAPPPTSPQNCPYD